MPARNPRLKGKTPALRLALLLACCAAPAPAARAAWPPNPAWNLAVCTAPGDQTQPVAVPDGFGGAIVAWTDSRASAGAADVYVQRVNAIGDTLWAANGVAVCTAAGAQYGLTLVADGTGGAVLAWSDNSLAGNYDIWVQRVDASGVPQWFPGGLPICSAGGDQTNPTLAHDDAGGTFIFWSDTRNSVTPDIYGQYIIDWGTPQWATNGIPICTASNSQYAPAAVPDGTGGAVVCWQDLRGFDEDLYAQRVDVNGTALWTADGVVVTDAVNEQFDPRVVADGLGGAIFAWTDNRNANYDIFAQHLDSRGFPMWGSNAFPVCTAVGDQDEPAAASDGEGGAILAWRDFRSGSTREIFTQRVSAGGVRLWNSTGLAVFGLPEDGQYPSVISDGAGGGIVVWQDPRVSTLDIYAQRPIGYSQTAWTATGGVPVSTATGDQQHPVVVPDGKGGGLVFWQDGRNGPQDIFGERIEHFGNVGNPEPAIASVTDVPGDQGGSVQVDWYPSYLDVSPPNDIADYRVWRSVPPQAMAPMGPDSRRAVTTDAEEAAATGELFVGPLSAQGYAWELVGTVAAAGPPAQYSLTVATAEDSIPGSNPHTAFLVQARATTVQGAANWFSAPDSGYSVDNLAPATPSPLTGSYGSGVTQLHWNPNLEPDLAGYRVYRDVGPGFTPGPSNLLAAQGDTGYVDNAGMAYYYEVTAVDLHGNESPPAAYPSDATGVPERPFGGLTFSAPFPNPAGSATTLSFALPEAGRVRLEVFDAAGRRVRLLYDGASGPGQHRSAFTLTDDAGRPLASGVYLVRLTADGRAVTRRVTVVR